MESVSFQALLILGNGYQDNRVLANATSSPQLLLSKALIYNSSAASTLEKIYFGSNVQENQIHWNVVIDFYWSPTIQSLFWHFRFYSCFKIFSRMGKFWPVLIATLQYTLSIYVFKKPDLSGCGPLVSSLFVLMALCVLLWNLPLYPRRLRRLVFVGDVFAQVE